MVMKWQKFFTAIYGYSGVILLFAVSLFMFLIIGFVATFTIFPKIANFNVSSL